MPKNRVTLILEGPVERDGHLLVSDVVGELSSLIGTLKDMDRRTNPSGGVSIFYEIVGLKFSSPAQIVVEAQAINPEYDVRERILNKFFMIIKSVQESVPAIDDLGDEIVDGIGRMVSPVGKTLRSLSIAIDGEQLDMKPDILSRIRQLLGPEETFPGFIRGMMEAINLHKGANVFRIYPDLGPQKVTCHFPSELENEAIKSIGHFVEVRGVLKYRKYSRYPHEIAIDRIEIFPDEESLPSLCDLHGKAPAATGDASSEEFVRRLRNATS